jgi:hypothetical protein
MGRPSSYNEATAELILDRIAAGESMRSICRDDGMPALSTLRRWEDDNEDFARRCAKAREYQGDSYVDMMHDVYERLSGDNPKPLDSKAASVMMSSLQWRASKLNRKRYGEVSRQEVSGVDGGPMQNVNVNTSDPVEAAGAYQKLIKR